MLCVSSDLYSEETFDKLGDSLINFKVYKGNCDFITIQLQTLNRSIHNDVCYIIKRINKSDDPKDWIEAKYIKSFIVDEKAGCWINCFSFNEKDCDQYLYRIEKITDHMVCYTYPAAPEEMFPDNIKLNKHKITPTPEF